MFGKCLTWCYDTCQTKGTFVNLESWVLKYGNFTSSRNLYRKNEQKNGSLMMLHKNRTRSWQGRSTVQSR